MNIFTRKLDRRSASDDLCDICSVVIKALASNSRLGDVIRGKTIRDVCASTSCALCRLIAAGLLNDRANIDLDENAPIEIFLPYKPAGLHGRLRVKLKTEAASIAIICEVGSVSHANSELRLVRGREIDPGFVTRWMSLCSQHHRECGTASSETRKIKMRLIDTEQSCLVEFTLAHPSHPIYATLSYVWGDVPSMRLSRETLPLFLEHGGLRKQKRFIPRTILDAIQLTRAIGIRYLWIDALCLVSNDEEDIAYGIGIMDAIYEQSVINIIAASGFDSSAGLPGVAFASRKSTQPQETINGTTFVARRNVFEYLAASRYATRGWTFQEQRLAPRSVVFVNQQLHWICKMTEWSEDHARDAEPEISWLPARQLAHLGTQLHIKGEIYGAPSTGRSGLEETLESFHQDLSEYSLRRLTRDDDMLNAFSAVLSHYSQRLGVTMFQGLILECLDFSLLFTLYQVQSGQGISQRRPGFPSYSWVGWRNAATPYLMTPQMLTKLGYEGYIPRLFYISWVQVRPDGAESKLEQFIKTDGDHITPVFPGLTAVRPSTQSGDQARAVARMRGYPVLHFVAAVVELQLEPSGHILDSRGEVVGWASLPDGLGLAACASFSWIILSRKHHYELRHLIGLRDVLEFAWGVVHRLGTEGSRNCYLVMATVLLENGTRERLALGAISAEAHFVPAPAWKEIILA